MASIWSSIMAGGCKAAHRWRDRAAYARMMKPVGFVLTFVAVTTAMIFFRATSVRSAVDLVKGVFGLNGVAMPHGAAAIAATYGADVKNGGDVDRRPVVHRPRLSQHPRDPCPL
jgi:D-alanyl-lipoteichoic acid acyltransferase DltB (MBOAT superfamily)